MHMSSDVCDSGFECFDTLFICLCSDCVSHFLIVNEVYSASRNMVIRGILLV
jgi:hypothetical protein